MRVHWGVIASIVLLATPAVAQVSDLQVGALVEALRLAAPKTGTENDGLYSEWQIKPENIPRWSKQCVGRPLSTEQFEASPVTARGILVCVMRDVFKEQYRASGNNESQAVLRTAAWWMTGDATRYNSGSTAAYTKQVLSFYQQVRSKPSASPPASKPPTASASPQPKPVNQLEQKEPASSTSPQSETVNQPEQKKPASSTVAQSEPATQTEETFPPSALPEADTASQIEQKNSAESTSAESATQMPPKLATPTAAVQPTKLSDAQIGALVEALRRAAPKTNMPNNGLYSEWQVKPDNIPRWSEQCIGRPLTTTQFTASPVTARAILVCVMGDVLQQEYDASGNNETEAVRRAAAWWMTGDASRYKSDLTASYTQKVLDLYQQVRTNPNRPAAPILLPHR